MVLLAFSLLRTCGHQQTQLRLSSIHFLAPSCITAVATHCTNLRGLLCI